MKTDFPARASNEAGRQRLSAQNEGSPDFILFPHPNPFQPD
jgi:hypothetical protein